jgi:hypothetical protein
MHLFVLQNHQIKDRLFLRQWSSALVDLKSPFVITYEVENPEIEALRFVGKRLAAIMNEAMIPAVACTGDQKSIFTLDETENLIFNKIKLGEILTQAQCIVLGSIVSTSNGTVRLLPNQYLPVLMASGVFTKRHIFVQHELSPLGTPRRQVADRNEVEELMRLFIEEKDTLDLATYCLPCIVSGPRNFHAIP